MMQEHKDKDIVFFLGFELISVDVVLLELRVEFRLQNVLNNCL